MAKSGKYTFGTDEEIVVNHLRRLADKIENSGTLVQSMTDTLKFQQEDFAMNTLIVKYADKTDQINLRMVSPSYAVLKKLEQE